VTPTPFDLSDRIAMVTGSSRGIGLAIAAGLARAGARVVLNGVHRERLEQTRDRLAVEFGDKAIAAVPFDVTDPEAVRAGVERVEGDVGPIEILVNNAGLQHRQPLLEVSLQDWNRVLTTDLTSAFLVGGRSPGTSSGAAPGRSSMSARCRPSWPGPPSPPTPRPRAGCAT
jgi:gluconate 5-dehydrogenase